MPVNLTNASMAARRRAAPKNPHEQSTGPGPDAAPCFTQPMGSPVISSVPGFAQEKPPAGVGGDATAGHGDDPGAVDQLIDVPEHGRSVSKTHLHLQVEASAVWVTDRNSTNGSAISTPDGTRTQLRPGEAVRADAGSTIHFGDRSVLVGTA